VRPYDQGFLEITDKRHGWKLGSRVLPAAFTIRLDRYIRVRDPLAHPSVEPPEWFDLTDDELSAYYSDPVAFERSGWIFSVRTWLELDIESSPTTPPRCVAMRAEQGISTEEQRLPLAGLVAESCAALASKSGSFELGSRDFPTPDEYEDALFEANRVRRRRRTREAVTNERLAEVARIALEHPRTPTEAVRRHFGFNARGYARRLIKRAEAQGLL
jgi:hypothetical protein